MDENLKVILRFIDGKVLKGHIRDFTLDGDSIYIDDETSERQKVRVNQLKAIFFVKNFEGNRGHREKKTFAGARSKSRRVFVKFKDGESLTGFLEGDAPWDKGFFLEARKEKGFYLIPVDKDSNNTKIFVVTSSVKDVALIGV